MVVRVAGGCVGLTGLDSALGSCTYPTALKNEWGYYSPIHQLAIYFAVLTPVEMRWEGKGRMEELADVFLLKYLLLLHILLTKRFYRLYKKKVFPFIDAPDT